MVIPTTKRLLSRIPWRSPGTLSLSPILLHCYRGALTLVLGFLDQVDIYASGQLVLTNDKKTLTLTPVTHAVIRDLPAIWRNSTIPLFRPRRVSSPVSS